MRVILFTGIIFHCIQIHAQYLNIKVDEDNGKEFHPCEPAISINPDNPQNMVATAILDKTYYTLDGGKTWAKQKVTSPHGVFGDPVVISGDKNRFYFFHLSDPDGTNWAGERFLDRIVCQRSSPYGKKWNKGAAIGLNHPKDQDKEWGCFDTGKKKLYATWTQFDTYGKKDQDCKTNILFSQANRSAKKWSVPMAINQLSGDCVDDDMTVEGAVPTFGTEGEIYVSWSFNSKIYFDRSIDGGNTWLMEDIVVTDQPGGWSIDIKGLNRSNGMPVIACDRSESEHRGTVYVNWVDQRNGEHDTDVWLARSEDKGNTWSAPIRVNDDEPGNAQFLTWMTIDQTTGYLYFVFYDRRNYDDLNTDVYLAYSKDGGKSFINLKISENPFIPSDEVFFGDYNGIAAQDGIIAPIWTRMDNKKTSIWMSTIHQHDLP